MTWQKRINAAKRALDEARAAGSPLNTDLAEAALNDLLDRFRVTLVTRNQKEGK